MMPRRTRSKLSFIAEDVRTWLTYIVVGAIILLGAGTFLIYTGNGYRPIGSGTARTNEDRLQLLSSGDCALRANGSLAGRVLTVTGPSRGMPHRRYQLAEPDRRRSVLVNASEVRIVPCATLVRDSATR